MERGREEGGAHWWVWLSCRKVGICVSEVLKLGLVDVLNHFSLNLSEPGLL